MQRDISLCRSEAAAQRDISLCRSEAAAQNKLLHTKN